MAEVDDKLKDYEIRKEGEAEILLHKRNAVFYNPVQVCSSSIFRVSFSFLFPKMGRCSNFFLPFFKKMEALFYRFLICIKLTVCTLDFACCNLL
jgi:hypothetical protein